MDPFTAISLGTTAFSIGKQLFGGETEEEKQARKAREEMERQAALEKKRQLHQSAVLTLESFPTNGIARPMFSLGGNVSSAYEAEKDEIIEGNPIGNIDTLSSALVKVKGQTHAEGGEDMFGGNFVYSNRIKVPKEFMERIKSL